MSKYRKILKILNMTNIHGHDWGDVRTIVDGGSFSPLRLKMKYLILSPSGPVKKVLSISPKSQNWLYLFN
jgi:hypothetical protein